MLIRIYAETEKASIKNARLKTAVNGFVLLYFTFRRSGLVVILFSGIFSGFSIVVARAFSNDFVVFL